MNSLRLITLTFFISLLSVGLFSQPTGDPCPGARGCPNTGGSNEGIICHWPPCGNVANQSEMFKWEPVEGASSYTFTIEKDGAVVFSKTTTITAVSLDFPNMGLEEDETYIAKVMSDNDKTSNEKEFTLRSKSDMKELKLKIKTDQGYQILYGLNKQLRKADILRTENYNLSAIRAHNTKVEKFSEISKVHEHFEKLRVELFPIEGGNPCEGL